MRYVFCSLLFVFYSCADDTSTDHLQQTNNDILKDTINTKNTSLAQPNGLDTIKENFKRLNSIAWTKIETRELAESTEGGEAKYYFLGDSLMKIVAKHYGETYQQSLEYYLLQNQLSFVLEKYCKYNRPIYYDSTAMKENKDTEAFDFDKAKITESRSYFRNGKLVHRELSEGYENPSEQSLQQQEEEMMSQLQALLSLVKKK